MNKHIISKIVYVNFAPYENAGYILTYLLNNFAVVMSFTFNFHKLTDHQHPSRLVIYKYKRIIYQCPLFQTPTTPSVAFILLPIRSLVIFAQLLFHLYRLHKRYGPFYFYFTVNAFTAWTGNILRSLRLIQKTIFWVWDYYPPFDRSPVVRFMRYLYWQFDIPATLQTDHVVFLNQKLLDLRKRLGIFSESVTHSVVGIGTDPKPLRYKSGKTIKLVYIGVLKKSHGLDLIFESAKSLSQKYPGISIEIIGGGPDRAYYQHISETLSTPVLFHGYIEKDNTANKILARCHIGIAPYLPDKGNVTYFSDPSKIKRYLEVGLPTITTPVFSFSRDIKQYGAGVVINYDSEEFIQSVGIIMRKYDFYQKNAVALAQKYRYQVIYSSLFPMLKHTNK